MAATVTVEAEALRRAVRHIVLAGGSNEREAALVAENLVLANLSGHDSHGVGMLPQYILAVVQQRLKINAAPSVIADTGAILHLHANLGHRPVHGHQSKEP